MNGMTGRPVCGPALLQSQAFSTDKGSLLAWRFLRPQVTGWPLDSSVFVFLHLILYLRPGGLQRCSGGGPAGDGNEGDEGTERRDRRDAAPGSPHKPAEPPSQNKTQPTRSNLAAPNSLSHNRATERSQILCGIKFYQRLSRCQRRSH